MKLYKLTDNVIKFKWLQIRVLAKKKEFLRKKM